MLVWVLREANTVKSTCCTRGLMGEILGKENDKGSRKGGDTFNMSLMSLKEGDLNCVFPLLPQYITCLTQVQDQGPHHPRSPLFLRDNCKRDVGEINLIATFDLMTAIYSLLFF